MRAVATACLLLALGGCATTAVPPELAEPTAHVRPIERGAALDVPTPAPQAPRVVDGPACEAERTSALVSGKLARALFAECLLRNGEPKRAASVVAAYLPEREDLRLRADLQLGAAHAEGIDEEDLNALVSAVPDDPWAWAALAREYEQQGRHAEANDALLRAKFAESAEAAPASGR